jgi:hypothetical protein
VQPAGAAQDEEPTGELDLMVTVLNRCRAIGRDLGEGVMAPATCGPLRCSSWTSSQHTGPEGPPVPRALDPTTPMGLYRYQPDPQTDRYPLALILPASDRMISSTLGELPRPDVKPR